MSAATTSALDAGWIFKLASDEVRLFVCIAVCVCVPETYKAKQCLLTRSH
jgi:hypothetical protein